MTPFDPKPMAGGAAGELPAVPGWATRWKLAKSSIRIDLHVKVQQKVNELSSCCDRVIPFFYSSFLLAFAEEEKHQFLTAVWVKCVLCELPTLSPESGHSYYIQGRKKVDILCAVFILGLHFKANWRFDSTMQIFFFAIQIFAIHFYVNLLSSNWHPYADFLLGHRCTLLTYKLGNLCHLRQAFKETQREFIWQRKHKAKCYSQAFALVLEKLLVLFWNFCSRH